jgi:hypothetical protein
VAAGFVQMDASAEKRFKLVVSAYLLRQTISLTHQPKLYIKGTNPANDKIKKTWYQMAIRLSVMIFMGKAT